ncbi:polysaccharide deacetylase family protein [Mesobacillus subterraneus]|uniref:Polysaccharide deacetylase n=1 Tax=Mesobacillus subterraneus TaxID=285983 RepID=A0A427TL58_9BACI|nr:polysaccharide deacetylase family protein [Mesobacillus subterraneus]RSD25147.1 polysaccharide deacetylase [Mesobacillus subterraneus]
MFSLKSKTARWCTVVCLVGGLITSSSAVASQVKKPGIQGYSQQQELKIAYNRTDEVLKKLETKPPRFAEEQDQLTPDPADIPAEEPATAPSKTVYLTFDDGPHKVSDQILSILDEYDAKATFFMLDGNMRNFPEAVKKMAEAGHALGAHGVTHDKKKIYQSPQTVVAEMDQTLSTIKEITGLDSTLIRTPYGSAPHMKEPHKKAVSDKGYQLWDWNVDSKDWYYRDKRLVDYTIAQVADKAQKDEPLVILLHEREETLAQLPELLEYLKKENYDFKALDAAMTPIHLK